MTGNGNVSGFDEGDRRMAVAEYVLGTLEGNERKAMERAIETDPQLAAEARFWETHFAAFNAQYDDVQPPSGLLARAEARLFPATTQARTGWFGSLVFWRSATGLALAAAVVGVGLNIFPISQPPVSSRALVATLEPAGGELSAVAVYDAQAGVLRVLATGAPAAEGQDYELWLVPADGAPLSVSLLTTGQPHSIALGDDLAGQLGEGVTLAVSLEPQGGSPTGAPTGPVLAAGVSSLI